MDTLIKNHKYNIDSCIIAATLAALIYNMLDNESAMNWSGEALCYDYSSSSCFGVFAIIEVFSTKNKYLKHYY